MLTAIGASALSSFGEFLIWPSIPYSPNLYNIGSYLSDQMPMIQEQIPMVQDQNRLNQDQSLMNQDQTLMNQDQSLTKQDQILMILGSSFPGQYDPVVHKDSLEER